MLRLERKQKYMNEFNLSEYDSEVLVKVKENSDFFNDCVSLGADPKKACNWVTGMLMGYLNENEIKLEEVPVKPEMIKELIDLIDKKTVSSKQAKEVFEDMIESGKEPNIIVKEKGMMQITDDASIHDVVMEVLKENDEQAREYNPEKTRMIYFFVGQVMKKTRGKANPAKTMEMLREELAKYNK